MPKPAARLAVVLVAAIFATAAACAERPAAPGGVAVNDVQSQINSTVVSRVETPGSIEEIQAIVKSAGVAGLAVSITGGRHAMGGQQFGSGTVLIDMSRMNR